MDSVYCGVDTISGLWNSIPFWNVVESRSQFSGEERIGGRVDIDFDEIVPTSIRRLETPECIGVMTNTDRAQVPEFKITITTTKIGRANRVFSMGPSGCINTISFWKY